MKPGDLVKARYSDAIGIVVDIIQKKVWRTAELGKKVSWDEIDPEPHAVVLYAHNQGTINIATNELEVLNYEKTAKNR